MLSTARNWFKRDECERTYKLGRTLGKGAFATVRVGRKKDGDSDEMFAVKVINKRALKDIDSEDLKNEVAVMNRIEHENIVRLIEVFDLNSTFYMVLEMCKGGELFDRIEKKDHYTEDEARAVMLQINSAIQHCHSKGVIHRDIKPENLLYFRKEPDETIKLADFGLSYILKPDALISSCCGTPGYMAPEMFSSSGYGEEVDMWALGVVLFILLSGCPPFYSDDLEKLLQTIKRGHFTFFKPEFDDVSEDAKEIIKKLLAKDKKARMTSSELMDSAWMQAAPGHAAHLKHFQSNMHAYNLRRKFRGAVRSVQVLRRLGLVLEGDKKESNTSSDGNANVEPNSLSNTLNKVESNGAIAEFEPKLETTIAEDSKK